LPFLTFEEHVEEPNFKTDREGE
jgi:hypothetical protein